MPSSHDGRKTKPCFLDYISLCLFFLATGELCPSPWSTPSHRHLFTWAFPSLFSSGSRRLLLVIFSDTFQAPGVGWLLLPSLDRTGQVGFCSWVLTLLGCTKRTTTLAIRIHFLFERCMLWARSAAATLQHHTRRLFPPLTKRRHYELEMIRVSISICSIADIRVIMTKTKAKTTA